MSKLIDRLTGLERRPATPFGFGAFAKGQPAEAPIALIGRVTAEALAKDPELAKADVDALLVDAGEMAASAMAAVPDGVRAALQGRLWGLQVRSLDTQSLKGLKEQGCDFVVFDPDGATAGVLGEEGVGKLIPVGSGVDEETARAVHELAVDAVLFTSDEELKPLTVQRLVLVHAVRSLFEKPFVMACPLPLDAEELAAFRDISVSGLLVEVDSVEAIAATREAMRQMPRRKPKPGRWDPLVPSVSLGPGRGRRHEEDEEEDDFEDE